MKKYVLLACFGLALVLLTGCAAGVENVLSAPFDEAEKSARRWVELCQQGELDKATDEFWSKAFPRAGYQVCETVYAVEQEESFTIAAVEDRGGLITSGEMVVVLERPGRVTGELQLTLAQTDDGVRVFDMTWAGYGYDSTYFWQKR